MFMKPGPTQKRSRTACIGWLRSQVGTYPYARARSLRMHVQLLAVCLTYYYSFSGTLGFALFKRPMHCDPAESVHSMQERHKGSAKYSRTHHHGILC